MKKTEIGSVKLETTYDRRARSMIVSQGHINLRTEVRYAVTNTLPSAYSYYLGTSSAKKAWLPIREVATNHKRSMDNEL